MSDAIDDVVCGLPTRTASDWCCDRSNRRGWRPPEPRAVVAAAPKRLLRQRREPAFHLIDPRRVRRREMQVEARVAEQPAMDERCLMRGVVVQDDVHVEVGWHLHINAIHQLAELGSAVPPTQFAYDLARGDVQRSEQRRGAVTFVVIVRRSTWPGRIGSVGWLRSSAWIWLFSSAHSTSARSGGLRYRPTMSQTFSINCGLVGRIPAASHST